MWMQATMRSACRIFLRNKKMGGPAAGVLIECVPSKAILSAIRKTLALASSSFECDEYCVPAASKALASLGLSPDGADLYVSISPINENYEEYSGQHLEVIERNFDIMPTHAVTVYSPCNAEADHLNLGKFILHIAEIHNGIIDFNGAILPLFARLPRSLRNNYFKPSFTWTEVAPYSEASKSAFSGNICALRYKVTESRDWAFNVSDTVFMREWLNHPEFHMIK